MYGINEKFALRLKVFQRVLLEVDRGMFALRVSTQFFIVSFGEQRISYKLLVEAIVGHVQRMLVRF